MSYDKVKSLLLLINEAGQKGDYKKCRLLCESALALCQDVISAEKADIYKYIGNLEVFEGNYNQGLDYYLKCLKIAEQLNNQILCADIYTNLGNIYHILQDSENALKYYEKSITIREKTDSIEKLHITYNNIASVYLVLATSTEGELKADYQNRAFINLIKALKIYKDNEQLLPYSGSVRINLANIYLLLEKFDDAKAEFDIVNDLAIKYNNKRNLIHCLMGLAKYYTFLKDVDLALENAHKAEKIILELNFSDELIRTYLRISDLYAEKKDFENAYIYKSKYVNLRDKVFTQDFNQRMTSLETKFEIERKEHQLEIFRLKNIDLVNAYNEISEQKSELEKLNKAKNELLGMVVHDLRNPISCIISLCDLNTHNYEINGPTESYEKNNSLVKDLATKMYNMVSHLLNYSSIETGRVTLELQEVNLKNIIERRRFYYQELANKKDISFIIDETHINSIVKVDIERITEVFDNLITNALKFTHKGGEVKIWFELHKKEIICNITDTGQGFTEEELKTLFKKFKKYKAKPTGGETSTGFGLLIIQKILSLHKSEIKVKSKEGKGTTFSFNLKTNN